MLGSGETATILSESTFWLYSDRRMLVLNGKRILSILTASFENPLGSVKWAEHGRFGDESPSRVFHTPNEDNPHKQQGFALLHLTLQQSCSTERSERKGHHLCWKRRFCRLGESTFITDYTSDPNRNKQTP